MTFRDEATFVWRCIWLPFILFFWMVAYGLYDAKRLWWSIRKGA